MFAVREFTADGMYWTGESFAADPTAALKFDTDAQAFTYLASRLKELIYLAGVVWVVEIGRGWRIHPSMRATGAVRLMKLARS